MLIKRDKKTTTREDFTGLYSALNVSEKENKSRIYAGLTVGSLVAFGALAGVGACVGIDVLQYVAIPFLFTGMTAAAKTFEVAEDIEKKESEVVEKS